MVTTLPAQWEQLHTRIGIERANAIKAHLEVRGVLELDTVLRSWEVDTVLIGSYRRKTAIYPCKDVDVFVKLPGAPSDATPEQVFTEVQRSLVAHFRDRATEQRRSMKISGFDDDLTCDAVPAIPDESRWKIPQTDRFLPREEQVKDRWETTDPERLTELTQELHKNSPQIGGQPSFLRMVRIIKQVRDTHLGRDEKPGGLYFELMAYWVFQAGVAADSFAELLVPVLDGIVAHLRSDRTVMEPAMGQPYDPAPPPETVRKAADTFAFLAAEARRALTLDDCQAALVWRRMLGQNDKVGWCFPLPAGCDEHGQRVVPMINRDRGPNTDRGFA